MIKYSRHIVFIFFFVSYLIVFSLKKYDVELPYFIQCYFADLLALPITLSAIRYLLSKYSGQSDYSLSLGKITFAILYFSLFFEWLLPRYSNSYTGDFFDFICYFLGGVIYFFIQSNFIISNISKSTPNA